MMSSPDATTLESDALGGAILLCVLAQSTGPLDDGEQEIVRDYLRAIMLDTDTDTGNEALDDPMVTALLQTRWSIKSLQAAAAQLVRHEPSQAVFPHFFARMAVASGYISSDRRLAIKRIQAAIRRAQKGK